MVICGDSCVVSSSLQSVWTLLEGIERERPRLWSSYCVCVYGYVCVHTCICEYLLNVYILIIIMVDKILVTVYYIKLMNLNRT